MSALPLADPAVTAFLFNEAALIDSGAFDVWFDLFTEDALYWMPLAFGQREDDLHNALFFEDRLLLQVRVERLLKGAAFSQSPPSRCQHVLQHPVVTAGSADGSSIETQTPFFYMESQGDSQFTLAGTAHHQLVKTGDGLQIRRKRIELINRDAALPSIQLFP